MGCTACGTYGSKPRCGLTLLRQPANNVQGLSRVRGLSGQVDELLVEAMPRLTFARRARMPKQTAIESDSRRTR